MSDEVWQRLDPYAGQLGPPTRRRLKIAAAIVTVVAVAVNMTWYGGLFVPRLAVEQTGQDRVRGGVEALVTIQNHNGWLPVRVLGVGRDGPGLELVAVSGFTPRTLPPGGEIPIRLAYRVTDCAAVTDQPIPIPITVARPWGSQTIHVHIPGGWTQPESDGNVYPQLVEWQRRLADEVC